MIATSAAGFSSFISLRVVQEVQRGRQGSKTWYLDMGGLRGFCTACRQRAATGLVVAATLLVVGAACGCSDVRGSAASSQAPIPSNAELAVRVKAALQAAYVNDIHVEVFVENGDVVLRGLVEDEHALLDVLDVARKAAEGHKVIDEITIMKTSPR
jgi:osmotically-inducible protein OsmY